MILGETIINFISIFFSLLLLADSHVIKDDDIKSEDVHIKHRRTEII